MSPRSVLLGLHQGMDRPKSQGERETSSHALGVHTTDPKLPPTRIDSGQRGLQCPLCLGPIEHLIHNIRSAKDYQNHYLLPLPTASSSSEIVTTFPPPPAARGGSFARSRTGAATMNPALPRHALYGRQSRTSRFSSSNRVDERDEATWREREQERALERRRYIYREGLYAKHVASNRYTGFKPFSPHTFSRNEELKAKVIKFIRREVREAQQLFFLPCTAYAHPLTFLPPSCTLLPAQLQVFPAVDVAFLTTYLVTIASQLDLRSPSAIRLISDFLSEEDAQHLVHEISTFARSPFTSLEGYDRFVQYGRPQRRLEEEEAAEEGGSMSRGVSDRPRFEEHMSEMRERGRQEEQEGERRLSAGRPPFASSTGRDSTSGNHRSGRSPSPPSAPLPRRYPSSGSAPNGSRPPPPHPARSDPHHPRQPYRPVEPNWRERDQHYTGSYYATAVSESRRGDGGNGSGRRRRRGGFVDGSTASRMRGRGGGGGPASSAVYEEDGGGDRRRYESRGRRRSPSLSLALPTRASTSPPPPRRRRRRYSEADHIDDDDGRPFRRRFSPAPLPRSYKDERETSPLPSSETRYQGPSRSTPSPRSPSPAHRRSRSRSRSKTPLQRPEPLSPLPSPPPPPPPPPAAGAGGGPAIDSELDDAISLVGPSFSIGPGSSKSNNSPLPSPLTATPAGPPLPMSSMERPMSSSSTFNTSAPPLPPPRGKPTLAIFGAARRLLGNGRVVTLAKDGRASLQPQSDVFRNAGAPASNHSKGGAAVPNSGPRQQESYYGQATPNRLTAFSSSPATSAMLGPSKKPLLGRLGGIVPPRISTTSTAPVPSASSRDAAASPTTPTSSKATSPADSLRARLHARLTAEYRQALAASSRSTTLPPVSENPDGAVPPTATTATTTTTTKKSDLRSLLQARLQAEKALAYEDLVRTRAAASLASARDAHERVNEPTVFSQETRDLLMARLDEERRFVDEEAQAGHPALSASASAFDTYEYGHDLADDDGYYDYDSSDRPPAVSMDDHAAVELAPNEKDLVASSPSSSSAAPAPAASATPSKSELSLKAALLAKRRAAIQDELKKFSGELKEKEMRQKLMMQKRRSGTTGGGGANAEAQVQADP